MEVQLVALVGAVVLVVAALAVTVGFLAADRRHRLDTVGGHERAVRAAAERASEIAGATLDARLREGVRVLDARSDTFDRRVGELAVGLHRVNELVADLRAERAHQHGQLMASLRDTAARHAELHDTTVRLRNALASPKARGQWGERMADDVLRAAGFCEGINYLKQTATTAGTIPDVTFLLPGDLVLHMDVKFPLDNYARFVEAASPADREAARVAFLRDVRQRVRELAGRGYIEPGRTVDAVLLFIPNEAVFGFVHEQDPSLLDRALASQVVLCSPVTLFSVLAVIRRAVENVRLERTSHEILQHLARFEGQWGRFTDQLDKVERQLDTARRSFDELAGTRRSQLEKELGRIDRLRARHDPPGALAEPDGAAGAIGRASADPGALRRAGA